MGLAEGRQLRDDALGLLESSRATIIRRLRHAMIRLYEKRALRRTLPFVNGDDATRWLDKHRCNKDYRLIGAVFRPKSGWKPIGYRNSRLKRRHARPVQCWQWKGDS
jgi:hypothetical protein